MHQIRKPSRRKFTDPEDHEDEDMSGCGIQSQRHAADLDDKTARRAPEEAIGEVLVRC